MLERTNTSIERFLYISKLLSCLQIHDEEECLLCSAGDSSTNYPIMKVPLYRFKSAESRRRREPKISRSSWCNHNNDNRRQFYSSSCPSAFSSARLFRRDASSSLLFLRVRVTSVSVRSEARPPFMHTTIVLVRPYHGYRVIPRVTSFLIWPSRPVSYLGDGIGRISIENLEEIVESRFEGFIDSR